MVERKEYLEQLMSWKDEPVIKVITGIHGCGKSTLLRQFQNRLTRNSVEDSQIISIDLEDPGNEELLDYEKLNAYVLERLNPDRKNYVFLDEVHRVNAFEKVLAGLNAKDHVDLYIAGSSAYLLNREPVTLPVGRYFEIKMLPLSFREFCEVMGDSSDKALLEYLKIGGFPNAVTVDRGSGELKMVLEGIYHTVIVKELEERQSRQGKDSNKRNVTDIALLKQIVRFLADTVGSPVTVRRITDFLASKGRKVSPNTVNDYLEALSESYVFYEAERFDIAHQQGMKLNRKFYIVDSGLRDYILPKGKEDLGSRIENIVFLELLRRGYQVNTGKLGVQEVDFVARKNGDVVYLQVREDMTHPENFEQEMKSLKRIKDSYEKIVLTLDRFTPGNYEGIKIINVVDWLLEK